MVKIFSLRYEKYTSGRKWSSLYMVRKSHRSSFKFYTLTCMNIIYIYIIHNTTSSNKHTHTKYGIYWRIVYLCGNGGIH